MTPEERAAGIRENMTADLTKKLRSWFGSNEFGLKAVVSEVVDDVMFYVEHLCVLIPEEGE